MMANRTTRRHRAVISGGLHPHYREVTETLARFIGFDLDCAGPDVAGEEDLAARVDERTSCVVVQRSAEHTSELPSLMRISYDVFCLKKQKNKTSNIKYR